MTMYSSFSGKSYTLGERLYSSFEGSIYEITGDDKIAAKIYDEQEFMNENERLTREHKLKAMMKMNVPLVVDGVLRFIWPLDILYENDSMVGFIMPKINFEQTIWNIHNLPTAKRMYPQYTWKYSVQYAYNLAWVVKYAHDNDIIIGDFNYNHFCIDSSTGVVILNDCDAFDIRDLTTGERFPCIAAYPELLAPELQIVGGIKNACFTKETDDFSLAIRIFGLLMRGEYPFWGIYTKRDSVDDKANNHNLLNKEIVMGKCPYVREVKDMIVPKTAPSLSILTPELQQLFQKTFNYNETNYKSRIQDRATAEEWCRALLVLAATGKNPNLVTCSANRYHVYPKHNTSCPWCKCENYTISKKYKI